MRGPWAEYVLGLAKNSRLTEIIAGELAKARGALPLLHIKRRRETVKELRTERPRA